MARNADFHHRQREGLSTLNADKLLSSPRLLARTTPRHVIGKANLIHNLHPACFKSKRTLNILTTRYAMSLFFLRIIGLVLAFQFFGSVHAQAQSSTCQLEGNLRSASGGPQVAYNFKNNTSNAVQIYWIDYNGSRVLYSVLASGQTFEVTTYVGHPWVIASDTGACIDLISPQYSASAQVVAIDPPDVPAAAQFSAAQDLGHSGGDPTAAARSCVDAGYGRDVNTLAGCWVFQMATNPQKQIANCIMTNGDWSSAAFCMAGRSLSPQGQAVARCALGYANQPQNLPACANLAPGNSGEALRLAGCVGANSADLMGAALCVGGTRLTPEQRVFAECAVSTFSQPYAFAACATDQLTINEFEKCITIGVGGSGCFGKNNFFIKAISDAWKGVSGGPNSILNKPQQVFGGSNSVFNDPAQIWGGPNSVFNNPAQIVGGPNSVVRNPGQIWGGTNSLVRRPDQILGGKNSFFHKNLGIHL